MHANMFGFACGMSLATVICKLLWHLEWPHAHVLSFNALVVRFSE